MTLRRRSAACWLPLLLAAAPTSAPAPPPPLDAWGLDPAAVLASGEELLLRAPDSALDGLLQALHASAQSPRDAQALCALFDPRGEPGLERLQQLSGRLGDDTRARFADAVAVLVVSAAQSPRQPYDPAQARQALKAAGVRAALLHDGFTAALAGDDHDARCRAVGQLLEVVRAQPLAERAAVTRLLLGEGLGQWLGARRE